MQTTPHSKKKWLSVLTLLIGLMPSPLKGHETPLASCELVDVRVFIPHIQVDLNFVIPDYLAGQLYDFNYFLSLNEIDFTLVIKDIQGLFLPCTINDFSKKDHHTYMIISYEALENCRDLSEIMINIGFTPLTTECLLFDFYTLDGKIIYLLPK